MSFKRSLPYAEEIVLKRNLQTQLRLAADVSRDDPEKGHNEAQECLLDFLCQIGYDDIAAEYRRVRRFG